MPPTAFVLDCWLIKKWPGLLLLSCRFSVQQLYELERSFHPCEAFEEDVDRPCEQNVKAKTAPAKKIGTPPIFLEGRRRIHPST